MASRAPAKTIQILVLFKKPRVSHRISMTFSMCDRLFESIVPDHSLSE